LIDVVFLADLPEEVPLGASGLEGTQDDVPAARIEETPRVAPIGVGDDRPIAATERSRQKLRDRGTFAGASRADEFEMLGFIRRRDRNAGNRDARRGSALVTSRLPPPLRRNLLRGNHRRPPDVTLPTRTRCGERASTAIAQQPSNATTDHKF